MTIWLLLFCILLHCCFLTFSLEKSFLWTEDVYIIFVFMPILSCPLIRFDILLSFLGCCLEWSLRINSVILFMNPDTMKIYLHLVRSASDCYSIAEWPVPCCRLINIRKVMRMILDRSPLFYHIVCWLQIQCCCQFILNRLKRNNIIQ